ncbi:MAG TPA: ATP-binding protein [Candidatus Acidoferrales bacterium]
MRMPHGRSIGQKLTRIILISCGTTILMACTALAAYEFVTGRRDLTRILIQTGDTTGANTTAALSFGDADSARETLSSLGVQNHIVQACIYTRDGTIFATYARSGSHLNAWPPVPGPDGIASIPGHIVLFQPIWLNGERIGTIYLDSDTAELYTREWHFAEIAVLVVLASFVTAYLLAARLQRTISEPVRELAQTVSAVSLGKDYSVRATKRGEDEVGSLVDGFNEMLDRIHERERALQSARDDLEVRVSERTSELQKEIAERKNTEQKLEERTAFFNSLIENTPIAIVAVGIDDIVQFCNPAFENIFGYRQADVIGKSLLGLITNAEIFSEVSANREELWGGKIIHTVSKRKRSDGSLIDVEAFSVPLGPTGHRTGAVMQYQDITVRKRAEEALVRAKDAAEAASRAKSEFLANMSHEIRTPMNGIIGMTELTLDTVLTAEQRDYLGLVQASADSLLKLINDILDFSKIEAGKVDIEKIEFHFQQSLDETLKSLVLRARQKDVELSWCVGPGIPKYLKGDVGRLRQVIVNLVGNAVKFTKRGEIEVRVEVESESETGVMLHFQVRDSGIGIPEEKQRMIFDAFTQVDSSTTRNYGGTGLGLAITSRLVQLMGGKIWVESELGRGSIFHFTSQFECISAGEQAAESEDPETIPGLPSAAPAPSTPQTAQGTKILLAEDNAVNRRLAMALLQKRGYDISATGNGQEALDALERENFDLVLMDVQMPVLDGLDAIRAIRAKEQSSGSHLPIIALTAHAMKGDRERCLAAGADDYVTKPIRTPDLLAAIDRATNTKASPTSTAPPAPPSHSAGPPVLDFAAALERVDGDRELLENLMGMFAGECPRDIAEIRKSLEARDMGQLERLAHTLKGASSSLAAGRVADAAFALEKQARTREAGNAEQLLEILVGEINRLLPEIEAFCRKVAP